MEPVSRPSLAMFAQLQALQGGGIKPLPLPAKQAPQPLSLTPKFGPKSKETKEAELMKACQDFESIMWNVLMQNMRAASPKSGFLDSSQEHDIFVSMQDEEFSKSFAKTGGLGISRMLFEQLKKTL